MSERPIPIVAPQTAQPINPSPIRKTRFNPRRTMDLPTPDRSSEAAARQNLVRLEHIDKHRSD